MGDSRNEEAIGINGFRVAAECSDRMSVDGMHVARRPGEPDVPAGRDGHLRNPVPDKLCPDRPLRFFVRLIRQRGSLDARYDLWTCPRPQLIGRR
jgi:hypothetical protein